MADDKQPEFVVTDRRRLTAEGELREGVDSAPPPPARSAPSAAPQQAAKPGPAQDQAGQTPDRSGQAAQRYAAAGSGFEKFNFEKIVLSFAQTTMLQLGLLASDPSQPLEPDIHGARETIDMLSVLQEKTRGNLTPQEQRLLDNSLYELRMAWLELSRRARYAQG